MKKIFCLLLALTITCKAQIPTYTATVNNPPPGYYFASPYKTSVVSYPTIFDGAGNVVYYKKVSGSTTLDFRLQPNGLMSYYRNSVTSFVLIDSTFNPIGTVSAFGYGTDVHELQILPNGHYLLLGYENTTQDLSMYNYFNHVGSPGSSTATVKSNIIQELDSAQNVVWEWHHKDYFPFDETDPFFLNSPTTVDWSHSNALEVDYDGNILMSSRHFNEITKIDRSSGNILWHFGGKYNQFTFTTDTVPFYGQHDIRRLSNGHVSLYDDGNHTVAHGARALEYELDETNMTAKLVWSYTYDSLMRSTAMGSVQVLPNKDVLIDYGATTRDSICFSMVDSTGSELYKIEFAVGLISYRGHYYPSLPWKLNRPTISCFDSLGVSYLKVDSSYSSYLWNDGNTHQTIPLTSAGTYYVFVPYGEAGGFLSSVPFTVSNISAACGTTTSVGGIMNEFNYSLFPNPASSQVTISFDQTDKNSTPVIKDIYGKSIALQASRNANDNSYTFDVSELAPGMYFVCTKYKTLKFIKSGF